MRAGSGESRNQSARERGTRGGVQGRRRARLLPARPPASQAPSTPSTPALNPHHPHLRPSPTRRFSPHRLQTEYLSGTGETGPLEARRYTLTHCDRTGHLQLSIGAWLCSEGCWVSVAGRWELPFRVGEGEGLRSRGGQIAGLRLRCGLTTASSSTPHIPCSPLAPPLRPAPSPPHQAGNEWNGSQLAGWYKALLRDEVLAEWRGASAARLLNEPATIDGHPAALPSLHIYCHITAVRRLVGSGAGGWGLAGGAWWRLVGAPTSTASSACLPGPAAHPACICCPAADPAPPHPNRILLRRRWSWRANS